MRRWNSSIRSCVRATSMPPESTERFSVAVLIGALHAEQRHLLVVVDGEDEVRRMPRRAAWVGQRALVDQHHVGPAEPGEVADQTVADDAGADDDDLGVGGELVVAHGAILRDGPARDGWCLAPSVTVIYHHRIRPLSTPRTHEQRSHGSLAERAYDEIRRMIIRLELAPGDVVREADLQAQLGIGRTPIREALQRLARDQFVSVIPRRGMFVSAIDVDELSMLYETRAIMEPYAARLATLRGTRHDWDEMADVLADTERPGVTPTELIELDRRCHEIIWRAVGQPIPHQHARHALRAERPALAHVLVGRRGHATCRRRARRDPRRTRLRRRRHRRPADRGTRQLLRCPGPCGGDPAPGRAVGSLGVLTATVRQDFLTNRTLTPDARPCVPWQCGTLTSGGTHEAGTHHHRRGRGDHRIDRRRRCGHTRLTGGVSTLANGPQRTSASRAGSAAVDALID